MASGPHAERDLLPSPIQPGFDLLETQQGATVDLSAVNLPPNIALEGVPLEPGPPPGGLGTTDTVVERLDGINPFEPPTGVGTVDIELVALHLKSVDPIDLTPLGGPLVGVFSDLHITIDRDDCYPGVPVLDPLPPSIGQMQIRHTLVDPNGGTFDSCFGEPGDFSGHPACATLGVVGGGVFADAIFVVVGGDPANPSDVILNQPAPRIVVSNVGGDWRHEAPPNYPFPLSPTLGAKYPDGGFFPWDFGTHSGPHPVAPTGGPAECALLLGATPARVLLGGGDVLLVGNIVVGWPVTIPTVPSITIPNRGSLLGLELYYQVVMINPLAFPQDPVQMSNGLKVRIGGECSRYGAGSGLDLWAPMNAHLGQSFQPAFRIAR